MYKIIMVRQIMQIDTFRHLTNCIIVVSVVKWQPDCHSLAGRNAVISTVSSINYPFRQPPSQSLASHSSPSPLPSPTLPFPYFPPSLLSSTFLSNRPLPFHLPSRSYPLPPSPPLPFPACLLNISMSPSSPRPLPPLSPPAKPPSWPLSPTYIRE